MARRVIDAILLSHSGLGVEVRAHPKLRGCAADSSAGAPARRCASGAAGPTSVVPGSTAPALPIDHRPAVGADRIRVGDWQCDLTGITPTTWHPSDRQVLAPDEQLRPIVGGDLTVADV